MNNKLKPCPFCGKNDEFITFFDRHNGERVYDINHYCPHSDISIVINIYGKTEEEVAEMWNRRVEDER